MPFCGSSKRSQVEIRSFADDTQVSPETKYIRKLEYKIWLLETSKSYRWTYPLRKAEEIFPVLTRLPGSLVHCLKPGFRQKFDSKAYLASPLRPYGWWENFPKLHYCLFNHKSQSPSDSQDAVKYDRLQAEKPTVIFVTHETSRTGAPILVLDLLNRFSQSHNVVVFSIGGGELRGIFKNKSAVFVGPIPRSNLNNVLKEELHQLKARISPEFAIVNSIESTEVLEELWRHDIPILHLVHEFAAYTRPRTRVEKSACFSSAMVFSAEIVRANALETFPQMAKLERHIFPQGICSLPEHASSDEEKERERAAIKTAFRPKNWPEDTVVVLGAGTVQLRKGLDLFISCAKKVIERNPGKRVRFVWIGSGFNPDEDLNYSCFIDEQIKRSGLGDSFALLNEVNELQCAYDSADIFFLSSKLDPLPLVAQDALFNRLPLVCFEGASGIPEHISGDPDASFGVVPYLDVEAAAEKIQLLLSDAALRDQVGEAGHNVAARLFDQTEYFSRLNQLGQKAAIAKRVEVQDRALIGASGCFNLSFAYPGLTLDRDLALKYYTSSWQTGIHRRKPFPGFHPAIYADHHPALTRDPLADFIQSGKPAGPWLSEVIGPNATKGLADVPVSLKAALHIHLHYPDAAGEIFSRVKASTFSPDLFISVNSDHAKREVQETLEQFGLKCSELKVFPNRGRDIGPLITGFRDLFTSGYDLIGHVHGKKSVKLDAQFANQWAAFLYENLLGGKAPMLETILKAMQEDPTIGLVFPDDPHVVGWEKNWEFASELGEKMGIQECLPKGSINFPVGTMFWARTQALKPLVDLNLQWEDYPEEPLPYDGSMLHAMERILPFVTKGSGFRTVVSHSSGIHR
jgi:glycosyltransferase involved in cell wall biosynthesis